eukprot:COSAG04_NODE_1964_length_5118_cov_53.889221_8_plen_154_part_00
MRRTNAQSPRSQAAVTHAAARAGTTNTQMRIDRREADKPHPSMDVDGDGTVSAFDLKLAKRFDDDGNGILDEEETANLRAMMAKQNVKDIATMMDASGKTDQDFEAIKKNILQGGKAHKGLMLPCPPLPPLLAIDGWCRVQGSRASCKRRIST